MSRMAKNGLWRVDDGLLRIEDGLRSRRDNRCVILRSKRVCDQLLQEIQIKRVRDKLLLLQ